MGWSRLHRLWGLLWQGRWGEPSHRLRWGVRLRGVLAGEWRVPPNPTPPDTPAADLAWLTERRVDMPIKCFETKLKLHGGELTLPRSYIYATRITPADTFAPFARRAKCHPGWRYYEIDASHSPNVTAPEGLSKLLQKIVAGG